MYHKSLGAVAGGAESVQVELMDELALLSVVLAGDDVVRRVIVHGDVSVPSLQ